MTALTREEVAVLLVWAFRDEQVEVACAPHIDALTIYCNVMALPTAEAATIVMYAKTGNVPPTDPIALARWTHGICHLRQMLQQPMCQLSIIEAEIEATPHAA